MDRMELTRREARRERRMGAALVVLFSAIMAAAVLALSVTRRAWSLDAIIFAVALAAAAVAALGAALALRPGEDARRLAGAGGRTDREQSARAGQLATLPATSLILVLIGGLNAHRMMQGARGWEVILPAVMTAVVVLFTPLLVMGWDGGARRLKRFLDDELTRAHRAEVLKLGFWIVTLAVTAIYLAGLWRPQEAVTALPFALWAAGAATAFRFAQLHRRAEALGGDE